MFRPILTALVALAVANPASAQDSLDSVCQRVQIQAAGARDQCFAAVQAAISGVPSLGLLIAGGNPTLGTSGVAGLRLGILPRVSIGAKLNVVALHLPDILANQPSGQAADIVDRFGAPAPAFNADLSIGLTEGFSVAPGLAGLGAISLLGSVNYLPFELLGLDGFYEDDIAIGVGGRIHFLDESFIAPGISLSVLWRKLGTVQFGDVCPVGITNVSIPGSTPPASVSGCLANGDAGEFTFDLTSVSSRLVVSKHLLGFGLTGGLGHDKYTSDLAFGFRGNAPIPGSAATPAFRVTDQALESNRWTAFASGSLTILMATLGVEAGWQQGTPPINGFRNLGSDFNPRSGTWFGSLGARLSL